MFHPSSLQGFHCEGHSTTSIFLPLFSFFFFFKAAKLEHISSLVFNYTMPLSFWHLGADRAKCFADCFKALFKSIASLAE